MNSEIDKNFYELCYDQYKVELEEAEKIYQKVSILLILVPVLGSISLKLARIDVFMSIFTRIDVFLYYFSFVLTWCLLVVSISYSIYCVMPRNKYKRIKDMEGWQDWRKKYQVYINETENKERIDEAFIRDITPKLAEAQTHNSPLNEKRRQAFQRGVFFASISIIPVGIQVFFYLLLRLQNILV